MDKENKKRKTDYEALNSSFMHIPNLNIEIARDFIDLGLREIYELVGRSPEVLYESLKKNKINISEDRLYFIRMAVYYAETNDPDPAKLSPHAWKDWKYVDDSIVHHVLFNIGILRFISC